MGERYRGTRGRGSLQVDRGRRRRRGGGRVGFAEWWNSPEIKPLQKHLRQYLSRWEILVKTADERGGATPEPEPDPTAGGEPFRLLATAGGGAGRHPTPLWSPCRLPPRSPSPPPTPSAPPSA